MFFCQLASQPSKPRLHTLPTIFVQFFLPNCKQVFVPAFRHASTLKCPSPTLPFLETQSQSNSLVLVKVILFYYFFLERHSVIISLVFSKDQADLIRLRSLTDCWFYMYMLSQPLTQEGWGKQSETTLGYSSFLRTECFFFKGLKDRTNFRFLK